MNAYDNPYQSFEGLHLGHRGGRQRQRYRYRRNGNPQPWRRQ